MLAAAGEGGSLMDALKQQVNSLRVDRVRTQQRRGSEQQRVRQRIDQKQVPRSPSNLLLVIASYRLK